MTYAQLQVLTNFSMPKTPGPLAQRAIRVAYTLLLKSSRGLSKTPKKRAVVPLQTI
jgi:hypothetical protein